MTNFFLKGIPFAYKKYRRLQLKHQNNDWNIDLLKNLVKKERNRYINYDDQAFLIYFVNYICRIIYLKYPTYVLELKHSCILTYISHCKPVIAIDEATDFSVIDLLAMYSLRHPNFSSVTLSGDIMQRMTNNGIKKWEDLIDTGIVDPAQIDNLNISYRQSHTLLSLAKKIYKYSTHNNAEYTSFIEYNASEPKPLMKISNDENDKLKWIADRIREIDSIYRQILGSLPSIAVFVSKEEDITGFANELEKYLKGDISIQKCHDGMILGDINDVRIYAIDKIKGLEFEAVFFHNLDKLEIIENNLLLKYLYVGLSRATFYLGITLSKNITDKFNFFKDDFIENGDWKLNLVHEK